MLDTQIHTIYRTDDGTRVPGVTTYLYILNKPAIIHWAWQQGVAGLDYNKVRDQAADTGTMVHYFVMCILEGREPELDAYSPQDLAMTVSPMNKFKEWAEGKEIEPILLEVPMVSEDYRYGGTPDFYGKVDGKLTLLDFKTSKGVYQEAFYQVAAYKKLLEEFGYEVETARILRIGKNEDEGFEERELGNLEKHWEVFLACQEIYNLQKLIRRETKELVE